MKKRGWVLLSALIVIVAAAMVSLRFLLPREENGDTQVTAPHTSLRSCL